MTAGREIMVVKLGGTTLADQRHVLEEVADVARGERLALVHGGGKRLTEWLGRLGVQSRFEDGLRVTDDAALQVALAVLGGIVNAELVAALRSLGADAVGLSGIDGGLLAGERQPRLGRVASVRSVRRAVLDAVWGAGGLPVVAPFALDEDGAICNVNADEAAAGLAAGLGAHRLVLLTDVEGVRGTSGEKLDTLTDRDAQTLIANGVIGGGMVPKVRCALRALSTPDAEAVIADGRADGALRRSISDPRFGTRLTRDVGAGPAARVQP